MTSNPSSRPPRRSRRGLSFAVVAVVVVALVLLAQRHRSEEHAHAEPAHAQGDAHDHHDHGAADAHAMTPPPEGGWETDAPLRTGMLKIQSAVAAVIEMYQKHELTAEGAKALTGEINTQFAYLAENCRLSPEADAALHMIIVQLLEGSARLEADLQSHDAIHQLASALATYAISFDHAGWKPLDLE